MMEKIYNFVEGLLEIVILVMAVALMSAGMFKASVDMLAAIKHILLVCLGVCLPLMLVRDGLSLFKK